MTLTPPVPLEAAWQKCLDDALARTVDTRSLALMVSRQSRIYLGETVPLAVADALAARLLFWFPRDLGKVALPVAELVAADAIPPRPLDVLDLGAGLGATSLGLVRALRGYRTCASITALDCDTTALRLLERVAHESVRAGLLPRFSSLRVLTRDVSLPTYGADLGTFDIVLVGLSLVELTRHLGDEHQRAAAIASHLSRALDHLRDDGALVVIEPATRDEARALQRARDLLVTRGVTVFAPCPHTRACPMLTSARDWCHEDIAEVSLPSWLVGVARAAGLRYEGLTFSYLTLRRDARTLASVVASHHELRALRLLSAPRDTKGKTEVIACGDAPGPEATTRLMELRRETKRGAGDTLSTLVRGEMIALPAATIAAGITRVAPGAWARSTARAREPSTSE